MVFITGATDHVACWSQRAAAPDAAVLWDYHVVLAVATAGEWVIWDLDTRLRCPVSAALWIRGTFPATPVEFQPRFLPIPAADYCRDLRSDRSHMRTAEGTWLHPPPSWPMITGGTIGLMDYVQRARRGMDLMGLGKRLAGC